MKTTISLNEFQNAFDRMRPDNFSYEGLGLLFDYFEDYEESTGEEIELDVIAICCDYVEDTVAAIALEHSIEMSAVDEGDEEGERDQVRAYLEENTQLIGETATGFVYLSF
jgi:hypothetical protein